MRILTVVACAALLAGCNTSYNYFEDARSEDESNPTTAFGMILETTGIVARQREPIEYEPRAPLAMPPKRDLPTPEERVAAREGVDWPVDPEEREAARRRAVLAAGEEQAAYDNSLRDSDVARASPETVQAGRLEGGGLRTGNGEEEPRRVGVFDEIFEMGRKLSPTELSKTFRGADEETALLTEDGKARPRRYLVEPPDDYRTPSPDAPLPEAGDVEHSEWGEDQLYKRIGQNKPARMQR